MIFRPMEMYVGACNPKVQGADSPGAAKKHTRNQTTALAISGFSAVLAELAGVLLQASPEGTPVSQNAMEGLEGSLISAVEASLVPRGLFGTHVPVTSENAAGLFEQPEMKARVPDGTMPSVELVEIGVALSHGHMMVEGDKSSPGLPVVDNVAETLDLEKDLESSGRPANHTDKALWEGPAVQPGLVNLRQVEILSGAERAPLEQPVAFETANVPKEEADVEVIQRTAQQAEPEAAEAVPGQAQPEVGDLAIKQVEPRAFAQKVERPERLQKDHTSEQPLPVISLKVQAEPVQGVQFKAAIQEPQKVADNLVEQIKDGLPKTVEFRLDPPGLGKMTVVVSSRGEEVCVKFIASSYGSHNALVNSQDALAHALSQRGLSLAGFFVDHGMAGESNQPRYESASPGRADRSAAYEEIQEQSIGGETILSSSVLDYRV